jgi:hypothetical protein
LLPGLSPPKVADWAGVDGHGTLRRTLALEAGSRRIACPSGETCVSRCILRHTSTTSFAQTVLSGLKEVKPDAKDRFSAVVSVRFRRDVGSGPRFIKHSYPRCDGRSWGSAPIGPRAATVRKFTLRTLVLGPAKARIAPKRRREVPILGINILDSAMANPVIVLDYDPNWPGLFQSLRKRIADALGDMAATVEHVGSTAVPGLAAKR